MSVLEIAEQTNDSVNSTGPDFANHPEAFRTTQQAAWEKFTALPMPKRGDEAWLCTDLRFLLFENIHEGPLRALRCGHIVGPVMREGSTARVLRRIDDGRVHCCDQGAGQLDEQLCNRYCFTQRYRFYKLWLQNPNLPRSVRVSSNSSC